MAKPKKGTPKKTRGRPPTTGRGTQIGMRWQAEELAEVDEWRAIYGLTRPEAIRALVTLGLRAKGK